MRDDVTVEGLPEGNASFTPSEERDEFEGILKGFYGNLYDFKEDNRTKNRVIVALTLCLLVSTLSFAAYVRSHRDVELRVIDTSQAADVPFRVLEFDDSVVGIESLYYYFFAMISTNLFSYNRRTLMSNWSDVVEFLDQPRMKTLMSEAEDLIRYYAKYGRFENGNPRCQVRNVLFLDDVWGDRDVKTVQVYVDIDVLDEDANVEKPATTYLVTYKFFNTQPKKKEQLEVNPLGIRVTEWSIQEAINGGNKS